MSNLWLISLLFLSVAAAPVHLLASETITPPEKPPNILLVVVDDMGFADLGSFGSEIPTPHLDQLAYEGIRFTNFITSSVCSPTRANLLTGVVPHKAGFGNLKEELSPNQRGKPGYEGHLNDRVVTIATLLRDAGYRTYMTGKWHLGMSEASSPWARGFDRSFAMLSNASHFSDMRPAYSPDPNAKASYREDRHMLDALPENFHYSSQFFADRLASYIIAGEEDQPFFAFLSFSAPHWPLQAPDDAIEKFRGKYDDGYDQLAARRLERQRTLGVVAADAVPAAPPPQWVPWSTLDNAEQRVNARAMEVYAAMISEIDHHTGRLLDELKNRNLFDDTVVIFMSDNGAEGHDLDETWPADAFPRIRATIDQRHDFSFEAMGRPGSYTFYGPGWAHASAPSLHLHKGFASEGGIRTAAFVHAPDYFDSGLISKSLLTAGDIACTVLDLAGVQHPGSRFKDHEIEVPSCLPLSVILSDGESAEAPRIQINETMGKIAVRTGPWKITRMPTPFGSDAWELYNLQQDLGESNNLAEKHPDILQTLVDAWQVYAAENGVILPDEVSGY